MQLAGTNQILNLAQREADLALRNVRPTHASLTARKVGELGGCAYASQLYLDRKGVPRGRDALAGHDLLAYEGLGGMPGFEWMRDAPDGTTIVFRANDPEALASAAGAGLGIAALPCLVGDPLPSLVRVPSLGHGRCDLFLVAHEDARGVARVRVVADFIADVLARHRAEIDPLSG